uniref:HGF activator n=1 Tax=Urocitellus parryii TaxID=9999 RepID=A0A8D2H1H8_UROPR
MGRWAWVPSPCPQPGLCAFLLLLLLLPRGTQPQARGCSPRPGSPAGSPSATEAGCYTPAPWREVPAGSGVRPLTTMTGTGPGATVWRL